MSSHKLQYQLRVIFVALTLKLFVEAVALIDDQQSTSDPRADKHYPAIKSITSACLTKTKIGPHTAFLKDNF